MSESFLHSSLGLGSTSEDIDEQSKKDMTEQFNTELDKNKDGVLDRVGELK